MINYRLTVKREALFSFPLQRVTDSQSTSMFMMDRRRDAKAKRWSHLRIIRGVVPPGKSSREGGKKKKLRERRSEMKAMSAEGRKH